MHDHDVVAAVLVEDRQVLLVHRSPTREAFPNVWDLPGGHIEDGESPRQAITRELNEELDIVAHPSHVEAMAARLARRVRRGAAHTLGAPHTSRTVCAVVLRCVRCLPGRAR